MSTTPVEETLSISDDDEYCECGAKLGVDSVDVVAGHVVGKQHESIIGDTPAHLQVTGVTEPWPETDERCPNCAASEFGIEETQHRIPYSIKSSPLITASNLASWLVGMVSMWILLFWILP